MGGVVPVVNVKGIRPGQLKLTGKVLADIYLGKITKWNDPADRRAEPGPEAARSGDHRGAPLRRLGHDLHLHQLPVQGQPGVEGARSATGTSVQWPAGAGGKGNEGVASFVQRIKGSIGYVEYAYAMQNKMAYAQLKNRDGQFVAPDEQVFQAAAAERRLDARARFLRDPDRRARARTAGRSPARPSS